MWPELREKIGSVCLPDKTWTTAECKALKFWEIIIHCFRTQQKKDLTGIEDWLKKAQKLEQYRNTLRKVHLLEDADEVEAQLQKKFPQLAQYRDTLRKLNLLEKAQTLEKYHDQYKAYITPFTPLSPSSAMDPCCHSYSQGKPWKILGKLGQGGFGEVYLVLDEEQKRFFCLKFISPAEAQQRAPGLDIPKRIQCEKELPKIFHDRIMAIYDYDPKNSQSQAVEFFVFHLEYVPGVTLKECWRDVCRWEMADRLLLLKAIIEGIQCLHLFGWIHRDLHAGNILVELLGNRAPKIIDFGLSKKVAPGKPYVHSIGGYGHPSPHRSPGCYSEQAK